MTGIQVRAHFADLLGIRRGGTVVDTARTRNSSGSVSCHDAGMRRSGCSRGSARSAATRRCHAELARPVDDSAVGQTVIDACDQITHEVPHEVAYDQPASLSSAA